MSDHSSAEIFEMIFKTLARPGMTERDKVTARKLYDEVRKYDFTLLQMYAEDSLLALGLARQGLDDGGGETILYLNEDYQDAAQPEPVGKACDTQQEASICPDCKRSKEPVDRCSSEGIDDDGQCPYLTIARLKRENAELKASIR